MKATACPKPAASLRNGTEYPLAGGQIKVSSLADGPRLNTSNSPPCHSFGYVSLSLALTSAALAFMLKHTFFRPKPAS